MTGRDGPDPPLIAGDGTAQQQIAWHALPPAAALKVLNTAEAGLSDADAAQRRAKYGPNVLPQPQPPSFGLIFLRQFQSPLIYLLIAAAVISLGIGDASDAGFILIVVLTNAAVGAVQEWRAQAGAEALRRAIAPKATVRRDGVRRVIQAHELVPGDLVLLEPGVHVPADIRLIAATEVTVDEALLTGESTGVGKVADAVLVEATDLADRCNMLHAGTVVLAGRAVGVVASTGATTELGRIASALAYEPGTKPPLQIRLERLARAIAIAMMGLIVPMAIIEAARGSPLFDIFLVAVALAVSAIPEGLPVAITVALAVGTRRMARRNVIVRLLPAVEGLGACTVIATDKTGTLTCNELTVKRLVLPAGVEVSVTGQGYLPDGRLERDGAPVTGTMADQARALAIAATLCNEASYRFDDGAPRHSGDTVDVALLVLARKMGIDHETIRQSNHELAAIPYESVRRFGAHFNRRDGGVVTHVKGAAEIVLPMCEGIDRAALLAEENRMASEGYRVIAVAAGPVDPASAGSVDSLHGLAFLGFVGLIDPVRPEVPDAIARCRRAGVEVVMITGDHPATATAIARELGIADDEAQVTTGAAMQAAGDDPDALARTVSRYRVFARVTPSQKTMLVQALRAAGHFVAVTGDGVNDAPALNAANIGVVMGRGGTDVARDAADLILADDNFASIAAGIEEGRIAYDNVRKVVYLLISTGAAEIAVFVPAIAFDTPLPLFAVQLLWLNLATEGMQHVALAFERGEPGILERPPRPPRQPIFDRQMIGQVLTSATYMGGSAFLFFAWCLDEGWSETAARNALLLLMVLFENVQVLNCRSELKSVFRQSLLANPLVIVAVIGAQLMQLAAMNIGVTQSLLRVAPVHLSTYGVVLAIALGLIAVMELFKAVVRRVWTPVLACARADD